MYWSEKQIWPPPSWYVTIYYYSICGCPGQYTSRTTGWFSKSSSGYSVLTYCATTWNQVMFGISWCVIAQVLRKLQMLQIFVQYIRAKGMTVISTQNYRGFFKTASFAYLITVVRNVSYWNNSGANWECYWFSWLLCISFDSDRLSVTITVVMHST